MKVKTILYGVHILIFNACIIGIPHYVAYRGGQRGRVDPGGTSEGAALWGKCENSRKMVKFT